MARDRYILLLTVCLMATRVLADDQPASESTTAIEQNKSLKNMLVINEDNSHFFGTRQPAEMTREGLQAFVDQYAASSITHLFLNANAMRASFRSSSRDAIWDLVSGKEPQDLWPQNCKRLAESHLDPYAIWIERCREKQISPWLSMRMNDVHSVDEDGQFHALDVLAHTSSVLARAQWLGQPLGKPSHELCARGSA